MDQYNHTVHHTSETQNTAHLGEEVTDFPNSLYTNQRGEYDSTNTTTTTTFTGMETYTNTTTTTTPLIQQQQDGIEMQAITGTDGQLQTMYATNDADTPGAVYGHTNISYNVKREHIKARLCLYITTILLCAVLEGLSYYFESFDELATIEYPGAVILSDNDYVYKFGQTRLHYDSYSSYSDNSDNNDYIDYNSDYDGYKYSRLCQLQTDYYYTSSYHSGDNSNYWCTLEEKGFAWNVIVIITFFSGGIGVICLFIVLIDICLDKYCNRHCKCCKTCCFNEIFFKKLAMMCLVLNCLLCVVGVCVWGLDNPIMQKEIEFCVDDEGNIDDNSCQYEFGSSWWCRIGIAGGYFLGALILFQSYEQNKKILILR